MALATADPLDDGSELSDLSAPPTPGPAASPHAASPEAATGTAPPVADSPPRNIGRRASRRVAETTTTTVKDETAPSSSSAAAEPLPPSSSSDLPPPPAAGSSTTRRASTRDRKPTARLRSPSPAAQASSPAAKVVKNVKAEGSTPKTPRLKVKLTVKSKDGSSTGTGGESGSSRGATPQPSTTKVTLRAGKGKAKKLADDLKDLADDNDDEQDSFKPEADVKDEAEIQPHTQGKRNRAAAGGRRRGVIADDDDEDEGPSVAPQRKRARTTANKGADRKAPAEKAKKNNKKRVDYSSDDDDDEEMIDAASDEDDLADLGDDAASESEEEAKGTRRGAKKAASKPAAAKGTPSKLSAAAIGGVKKASVSSAPTTSSGSKTMSAEARMRASIDAAKDKSLKPTSATSAAAPSKLNPQASAFRPSLAGGTGGTGGTAGNKGPAAGSSTPNATTAGVKRPQSGKPPAFGKSMSGWDQLFGGISGLTSATPPKPSGATPTKTGTAKPSTPSVSGQGIRPDPTLEASSPADVQRLKEKANEGYLNTDECFDLLAHADIMSAFERSMFAEDKRLALRLRPVAWKAGALVVPSKMGQEAKKERHGQTT